MSTRRDFLTVASIVGLEAVAETVANSAVADPASERPKEGDVLVSVDAVPPVALEPKDLPDGGPPIRAWPMDPASNVVRSRSRLNRVLLVRLDPSTLVGPTKDRAAEGVVAYTAICPHAGCEVAAGNPSRRSSNAPATTRTTIRAKALPSWAGPRQDPWRRFR